jgi:Mrp family chromosome partitioning ATPase
VVDLQNDLQRQETAINTLLSSGQQPDEALFNTLNRQAIETDQRLAEAYQIRPQNPALVSENDRQITALEVFRNSLTAQIAAQSRGLIELQQLRREAQSTRALYTTLLAELQQTQVLRGTGLPVARILSPATHGRYVAPRKVYIIVIAALLGVMAGVFGALIAYHKYIQARTVEHSCDGPIFGRFPRQMAQRSAVRKLIGQPLGPLANAAIQLRTEIISGATAKAPQIIVSTSCRAGDTRAQVTVALGHALARLGRSVILIDADMCNRSLSRLVPVDVTFGLGDAIAGDADLSHVVFSHPTLGFDMIAAAQPVENPADLLSKNGFSKLLDQARATYDHIIIDAAPVLSEPSAQIILQWVDTAILTLREGKTLTKDFTRAQSKIRAAKTVSYGVVMVAR